MKRVLVTGATGFIGFEVARRLAQMGLRPRLLVRRPLRAALLAGLDAEIVQGDLGQPASLRPATDDVDTILHLGARAVFEEYSLVRPTIVDGSISLLDAARQSGVKRFVFTSSLLVYENQSEPIEETTPAQSKLGYGRAKIEAESALKALATQSDIALSIIRLPHVYGARDLMFNEVKRGRVFFPGSGKNRFAHLHVVDAARVLIRVAESNWTGTSPVADDLPVSWNEFFDEIRKYYPRFRGIGVPRWLATLGTHLLTPYRRLRGEPSVYTPQAVQGWNLNLPVKPGLLWRDIGLEPKYPTVYQGIPAALNELVAFQWLHPLEDHWG